MTRTATTINNTTKSSIRSCKQSSFIRCDLNQFVCEHDSRITFAFTVTHVSINCYASRTGMCSRMKQKICLDFSRAHRIQHDVMTTTTHCDRSNSWIEQWKRTQRKPKRRKKGILFACRNCCVSQCVNLFLFETIFDEWICAPFLSFALPFATPSNFNQIETEFSHKN